MGIQTQQGSSLVEVMVALFVLAIGLLGMLAMQAKSMQYNQTAYSYSQAAYLASDMAERIRSNPTEARTYASATFTETAGANSDCTLAACDASAIVVRDAAVWAENIADYLPGGIGTIALEDADFLKITVSFADDKVSANQQAGERQAYSLIVEI